MKKAISRLLALVLCLSLCACGGGTDTLETKDNEGTTNTQIESQVETTKQSIDILGEWVWVGDNTDTLTFNEDNTCLYSNGDSVKYSVDTTLAIITIYDNTTKNFEIVEENGIVKISGSKIYVRAENYENAHAEYVEAENARKEAAFLAAMENMEALHSAVGTEYEFGTTLKENYADIDVTILSAEFGTIDSPTTSSDVVIWFVVKFQNNTDKEQWAPSLNQSDAVIDGGGMTWLHSYSGMSSVSGGIYLDWGIAVDENGEKVGQKLPANSSVTVRIPYWAGWSTDAFQEAIEYNGHMNGFFSFVVGDNTYYIDMANLPIIE